MALGIKTKSPAISYKYPWEDPAYRAQYATPGVGSSVQVEGGQEWRTDPDSPNSGSAPVEMTMDQAKGKYISDWLWANNPEFKSATLDLAPSKQLRGVWGKATTTPSGVFKKGVGGTGWAYIDDSIAKLENPSAIFTLPPELGGGQITPRQNITYKRDDPDFMDKAMSVAAPILGFMAGGPLGAAVGGAAGADTMGGNPLKGALIAGGASMLPGVLKNTFDLSPTVASGVTSAAKTALGGGDLSDVLKSGTLGYGIPTVGKDVLGLTPGSPAYGAYSGAAKALASGQDLSGSLTSAAMGAAGPFAGSLFNGSQSGGGAASDGEMSSADYWAQSGAPSLAPMVSDGVDLTPYMQQYTNGGGAMDWDIFGDEPIDSGDYWSSVGLGSQDSAGYDPYFGNFDPYADMSSSDYWTQAGLPPPEAGTYSGVDLSQYTTSSPNSLTSLLNGVKSLFGPAGAGAGGGLSGGGAVGNDFMDMLLRGLPAAFGAYASNQQTNSLEKLAKDYMAMGAPYRSRLSNLYADPNSFLGSNEVQVPVQQASDIMARSLSMGGNPVGSGNALQQLQSYSADQLFGRLGQEKDRLAGFGGLAGYNAAAPQASTNAIGSQANMYNAIGGGVADIFNPPKSLAQQLAELKKAGLY